MSRWIIHMAKSMVCRRLCDLCCLWSDRYLTPVLGLEETDYKGDLKLKAAVLGTGTIADYIRDEDCRPMNVEAKRI